LLFGCHRVTAGKRSLVAPAVAALALDIVPHAADQDRAFAHCAGDALTELARTSSTMR
jgi:hypothetical protein